MICCNCDFVMSLQYYNYK